LSEAKLPFSRPSIGEAEIQEVVEVLRSGWLTSGPRVQRFEADFARYVGARHAISLTSCTAALHLAMLGHGLGPGDEVVVPSMTWGATANVVELVGARPVFADVDRGTLQLTAQSVAPRLGPRTRAIVAVHFAGQACDVEALAALAEEHGALLIHDAAHAAGTEHRGRRIGSDGRTACWSFHPIKNLTTGEGGMLTTNDDALAERIRLLRFHGVSRDAWTRYGGSTSPRYETLLPGLKYNMTDIQAALGIHQLARLDGFIERRTALASLYRNALAGEEALHLPVLLPETTRHAWHLMVVALELRLLDCDRDGFMARLAERGIGTGLHFTAVHLHRYYRERYGHAEGDLPESEWASERVLSLPLFPAMTEADVGRVCEAIREVVREVRR